MKSIAVDAGELAVHRKREDPSLGGAQGREGDRVGGGADVLRGHPGSELDVAVRGVLARRAHEDIESEPGAGAIE
nr:hypothetical protein [Deltaproteobacteria bacterium]